MSIIDIGVIDSVVHSNEHSDIVLLITDHLDWSQPEEHLLTLQQKLNTYIAFIESGQVFTDFPEANDKVLSIMVACKFEPINTAILFFEQAEQFFANKLNVKLHYSVANPNLA